MTNPKPDFKCPACRHLFDAPESTGFMNIDGRLVSVCTRCNEYLQWLTGANDSVNEEGDNNVPTT